MPSSAMENPIKSDSIINRKRDNILPREESTHRNTGIKIWFADEDLSYTYKHGENGN